MDYSKNSRQVDYCSGKEASKPVVFVPAKKNVDKEMGYQSDICNQVGLKAELFKSCH